MKTHLNQITEIDYYATFDDEEHLSNYLKKISTLISPDLTAEEKTFLQSDFDFYLEKGKFLVLKTFAGGIIFLREPEIIDEIKIEFNSNSNDALASVEYGSEKRNARNVKYKPNAGKIERSKWNMLGVFPNFKKYNNDVKVMLIAVIGKIVKRNCEHLRRDSWFVRYEKEFEIKLYLDGDLKLKYNVEID